MSDGRNPESICADCSSPNPTWASLNRGVLVCDDCCGVHRSLGRHISFIKSLHSTNWSPAVREMVSSLVRKGANSIWEHALHDTSSSKVKIKKPGPRDKIHPNKHDFIVAKYKHLSLLPRISVKEATNMAEDLSKQLHASVRTSNLETCLRLLSMGADPNYLHPGRGNTPLHVAAHANQGMQVELLIIYGANPMTLDQLGHTPEECARIAGHHQLADRLIESQYQLTDRLSFFLCGRKPLHSSGEHYLIPHALESLSDPSTEARNKLQQLSNEVFEELASDIFDEVDRRETDAIWLTTQSLQDSVAFLPVNPAISPMRNQGRQKLATLDGKEFSQLVTDVLTDTKRRQNLSLETGHRSGNVVPSSGGLVPEHDYDDVAMEDENRNGNDDEVELRKHSKLMPPVESTYSIVGEDMLSMAKGTDEHYSRLRDKSNSRVWDGNEKDEEGGVSIPYSSLSSPDTTLSRNVPNESAYSMVLDNQPGVVAKSSQKTKPPLLPTRPKTTYDRSRSRPSLSSPSPTHSGEEEVVSKKKFDLIMQQLRKIQKEKEELMVANQKLNEKVDELQRKLNTIIVQERTEVKSPSSSEPTTPKSPLTSPLDPPTPPLPHPSSTPPQSSQFLSQTPPTSKASEQIESVYSQVNKKKPIKPTPPIKAPLAKTHSTPGYKRNTSSPLPYATTPPLQPASSAIASPTKKLPSGGQTTSPLLEEQQSSKGENPVSVEDDEVVLPPVPPHLSDSKAPSSPVTQSPKPVVPSKPINPAKSFETSALPPLDKIHMEIKSITICIQELLKAGQTHKQKEFVTCSVKITGAVDKLIGMFPTSSSSQAVDNAVKELSKASAQLKAECQGSGSDRQQHPDQAYHTRVVMNSAYDVAKAARFLVTCVEKC